MQRIPLPSCARLVQWIYTPLAILLLAAAASALCGVLAHANGYIVLWGTLAAIALGTLYPWVSVRMVQMRLSFDQRRVREGTEAGARLVIVNRWPLPLYKLGLTAGDEALGLDGQWVTIGPWARQEIPIHFVPVCRGEYPREAVWITCGFPFGIYRVRKAIPVERRLIVWPQSVLLEEVEIDAAVLTEHAHLPRDFPGHGGDVLGLRSYRRGDPLRLVHWRQTARHQRLVVREVQAIGSSKVTLILDSNPASYDDLGPKGQREWAVRAAATLCERWIDRGIAVEMVLDGRPLRNLAADHLRTQILDGLARLADTPHAPVSELIRGPGRMTYVIITSAASKPASAARGQIDSKLRFITPPPALWTDGPGKAEHRSIDREPPHGRIAWESAEVAGYSTATV